MSQTPTEMDETEDEVTPVKQQIPDLKMLDERLNRRSGKHALDEEFFDELQMQVGKWSHKNFGVQGAHRPAMGIVEELTELYGALDTSTDSSPVEDAIGDTVIYMADYFYNRGWSLSEIWLNRLRDTDDTAATILRAIGKLCHSHLKSEQGIRGKKEEHDLKIKDACGRILGLLDEIATDNVGKDAVDIIRETWAVVSQRDWTKNPVDAHLVAEGKPPSVNYEVGDDDDGVV